MKVYVDELPKSCEECPFCEYFEKDAHGKGKHEVACYFNGSLGNILYGNQTSPKTCPIQSLTDYTKQVRKEVCEKFVDKFMMEYTMGDKPVEDIIYEVKSQIQGDNVE